MNRWRSHAPQHSRSPRVRRRLGLVLPFFAGAQQDTGVAAPYGAVRNDPGSKKILGLADIGRWNRIANTGLSADGQWMTYVYQPNDGDGTLYVRQLDGAKIYTIPVGSAPVFSDNSRFVGYFVSPPSAGAGRGGRGGGGGRGQAAPGAAPAPVQRRFEVLDLTTGDKYSVPDGASFKFSKGSRFVAVRTNKANAAAKHNGADLVLRDLTNGASQNIGNVNLYEFDDAGRMLAYTVDAADRRRQRRLCIDLATSQSNVAELGAAGLRSADVEREGREPRRSSRRQEEENLQRDNVLLVWQDAASPKPRMIEYDPAKDASFPKALS